MSVKLIVCDWEGCISEPGGGTVPWATKEIVKLSELVNLMRLDEKYPPVVLCSGRQFPYGEAALQAINAFWNDMPSILENGAGLYYPITKQVRWNPAITPKVNEIMVKVRSKVEEEINKLGINKELGKEFCISLNPINDMTIEWLYQYITRQLADYDEFIEITHSKSAVDITPKGVNKGSGVKFLSYVTGIELKDILGIGDTKGDLPMLKLVGYPACPQNADRDVAQIAKYVSPFSTTKGVIDIIIKYIGIDFNF